jgi:hypothetical protein
VSIGPVLRSLSVERVAGTVVGIGLIGPGWLARSCMLIWAMGLDEPGIFRRAGKRIGWR